MMSYVVGVLVILSVVFSIALGTTSDLSSATLSGGINAIKMCIELLGTIAMWNGIMRIAEKSGLCDSVNKMLSPITRVLFKGLDTLSPKALNSISLNITANILGLGSAATPMALDAMTELDRLNGYSPIASDHMVVFVALNTASFQILPTTVATLRSLAGSAAPMDIVLPVWITSAISVTSAMSVAMLLRKWKRKKGGEQD